MNRTQRQVLAWGSGTALLAFAAWAGKRLLSELATEQAPYQLLGEKGGVELRDYSPAVVAATEVEEDFLSGLNTGFHRIAGYIFGGNRQKQAIEMTAPVTWERTGKAWRMTFIMPPRFTLESLPLPEDAHVRLEAVPGRRMAALRFSGSVSEAVMDAREAELLERLSEQGLQPIGVPILAQYNSPFVPPFLRHNELLVEVSELPVN